MKKQIKTVRLSFAKMFFISRMITGIQSSCQTKQKLKFQNITSNLTFGEKKPPKKHEHTISKKKKEEDIPTVNQDGKTLFHGVALAQNAQGNSPELKRNILGILFSNHVHLMAFIFISPSIPSALITSGMTVTFMFHNALSFLVTYFIIIRISVVL